MIGDLSDRKSLILSTIIDDYIVHAEPVGSASLSSRKGINLSSATVRNAMSELEAMGYLTHPHISAGRVPTEKAYRFYLNHMLKRKGLSKEMTDMIEQRFSGQLGIEEALQESSKLLSNLSRQAGIVLMPRFNQIIFKRIEFIDVGNQKLLAVMISRTGVVMNKLFDIEERLERGDLEKINNYLNSLLEGLNIQQVKEKIFEEMKKEKALYNKLLDKALKLGAEAIESQSDGDFYLEGTANFLDQPEFSSDVEKMKKVFMAFEKKSLLLKLLDESVETKGLNVCIGDENGIEDMEGVSLITYPYGTPERSLGCIGVVGPTRMDYSTVIPIVEYTATKLNRIIRED